MNVILANVQYHPNSEAVALYIVPPAPLTPFFVSSTQVALQARAEPDVPWSDAEAIAEAQAGVTALYPAWDFTVVLPDPPAPPEE